MYRYENYGEMESDMINWISPFNYDFAIATLPVQIILLVFYGFRRNLPLMQSYCFWYILISNFVMTTADIISCEMNEIWKEFPLWIMYAVNHAYFLGFILRGFFLFAYTVEASRFYNKHFFWLRIIVSLPAAAAVMLILSSPWTAAIYTFSADGYHNCSFYPIIYFSTYFYIGCSLVIIAMRWGKMTRRIRAGLLSYNLLLLFGILVRKQFYHMLVTSYFSLLSILIIFLTAENPDLYRDSGTGFLNKNALYLIGKDIQNKNIPFSLMTISLHNFGTLKAIYSMEQIKETLKIVASWLAENYPDEYLFWTENGSFIILFKGHQNKAVSVMTEEWKEKYTHLIRICDNFFPINISMMLLSEEMISKHSLIISDIARYAIVNSYSENRRDNFSFTEEMIENVKRQRDVEKAIKRAMAENRFEVYFQPIYSVKTGKIEGAEALARLKDPDIGNIPPVEFIQTAERNGDIIEIGKQIFEKVCIFLENTDTEKLGIRFISVNLSPIQCISRSLSDDLYEIAKRHGIPMSLFDFEITESMIDDYTMILTTIAGLSAKGSEFFLDDFGTGAANLTSLVNLPIHVVKIDMSFVWSYFEGKAGFLPDLINLFKHSKMGVIVEGIETIDMKNKMEELGCDYEQGYFFSKPLPPEDFITFMTNHTACATDFDSALI